MRLGRAPSLMLVALALLAAGALAYVLLTRPVFSECSELERTWAEVLDKELDALEPMAGPRVYSSGGCDADDHIIFAERDYRVADVDAAVAALSQRAARGGWRAVDHKSTNGGRDPYLCATRTLRGAQLYLEAYLLGRSRSEPLTVSVSLPPKDYGST